MSFLEEAGKLAALIIGGGAIGAASGIALTTLTDYVRARRERNRTPEAALRAHILQQIEGQLKLITFPAGCSSGRVKINIDTSVPTEEPPHMILTMRLLEAINKEVCVAVAPPPKGLTVEDVTHIKRRAMRAAHNGTIKLEEVNIAAKLLVNELAMYPDWERAYLAYNDLTSRNQAVPDKTQGSMGLDKGLYPAGTGWSTGGTGSSPKV